MFVSGSVAAENPFAWMMNIHLPAAIGPGPQMIRVTVAVMIIDTRLKKNILPKSLNKQGGFKSMKYMYLK